MTSAVRIAALLAFSSLPVLAETWTGYLVDAKCYAALQGNVNPTDTETFVDRDISSQISYCSPKQKTKSIAFLPIEGQEFSLDPAGNAQALDLVRKASKRRRFAVKLTGKMTGNEIQVDTISELSNR